MGMEKGAMEGRGRESREGAERAADWLRAASKLYSSNFQTPKSKLPRTWGKLVVPCPLSNVQRLCYILCVDFLKSLQSSVFTQPRSTAVSTHLITYTTASFHLGKFGDDRYSSFVVEKKYSAEVRPNFGTRSACAPKYSASAEHCKGHVRCISTTLHYTDNHNNVTLYSKYFCWSRSGLDDTCMQHVRSRVFKAKPLWHTALSLGEWVNRFVTHKVILCCMP